MANNGWYGVDLDGTLADDSGNTHFNPRYIGPPIRGMVDRIRSLLEEGKTIKIFTARVHIHDPIKKQAMVTQIQDWLEKNGLPRFEVTNVKTTSMRALFDDRAFHVIRNTGEVVGYEHAR